MTAIQNANYDAPLGKRVNARVCIPGSKSLTNRYLVLAAIASGESVIRNFLESRDTNLMIEGLGKIGCATEKSDNGTCGKTLKIFPAEKYICKNTKIDCGLAGTVMRFLPVVAGLCEGEIEFFGDQQAIRRPMSGTIHALKQLGVRIDGERLPFTVHGTGKIHGGALESHDTSSSQFISGLLLAASRFENGLILKQTAANLPSLPYIEMTVRVMRDWGIDVTHSDRVWTVTPGRFSGKEVTVEPDLSNAAPFMIAAIVTESSITIENWPHKTLQPGKYLETLLPQFGGRIEKSENSITIYGTGKITGIEADLGHIGELVPNLVALAALADTPSLFRGIGHIRHHETDRIEALVREINALGGSASAGQDYIKINPVPFNIKREKIWRTYKDHRMAASGAIIGLRHKLTIEDIECTNKTFPEFATLWNSVFASKQSNKQLGSFI